MVSLRALHPTAVRCLFAESPLAQFDCGDLPGSHFRRWIQLLLRHSGLPVPSASQKAQVDRLRWPYTTELRNRRSFCK